MSLKEINIEKETLKRDNGESYPYMYINNTVTYPILPPLLSLFIVLLKKTIQGGQPSENALYLALGWVTMKISREDTKKFYKNTGSF